MNNNVSQQVVELFVDDIIPNRFQPREVFDENALKELSDSIKMHGVIQPIIVRQLGDKYEIIAGERRYKANIMAGFTKIPAIIRNLDDKETAKVALLENLQRKNLSPIEEARTYQKILDLDSMTQEELGKTMGKSQASIANKLRLLQLSDEVQEALLNNQISERHARSLLSISDKEKQVELLNRIISNKMSVRDLDNLMRQMGYGDSVSNDDKSITASSNIDIDALRNQSVSIGNNSSSSNNLSDLLQGTNVLDNTRLDNAPTFDFFNQNNSVNPLSVPSNPVNTPPVEDNQVEIPQPTQFIGGQSMVVPNNMEVIEGRTQVSPGVIINDPNIKPPQVVSTDMPNNPVPLENNWTTGDGLQELPIPNIIHSEEPKDLLNVKDAINAIRELSKELEKNGVKIDLTEVDLDNIYQIVVKIVK